jgi:hypothetical protein
MKIVLSLAVLAALTTLAHAQQNPIDKPAGEKAGATKTPEPNSPWSVKTIDRSDGYFGSSSTTVTRDIGDGWSVGGKLSTPYEDPKIGGSGAPGLKQYESPGNNTVIGPVFEKKF